MRGWSCWGWVCPSLRVEFEDIESQVAGDLDRRIRADAVLPSRVPSSSATAARAWNGTRSPARLDQRGKTCTRCTRDNRCHTPPTGVRPRPSAKPHVEQSTSRERREVQRLLDNSFASLPIQPSDSDSTRFATPADMRKDSRQGDGDTQGDVRLCPPGPAEPLVGP